MLVSKYQSYMLDLEYNVMAYIGNLLSTYSLLPRLRSALCEYRISLLDKSIELSKARCAQYIKDIEAMRKYN
jgi:hypothetical protein